MAGGAGTGGGLADPEIRRAVFGRDAGPAGPEGPEERARLAFLTEVLGTDALLPPADDMLRRLVTDVMAQYGQRSAAELRAALPQMRVRAASWARARAERSPAEIRSDLTDADVETLDRRLPYVDYFALEEQDLRFRRFDGDLSAPVTRAGFASGDAVTVLPYDPARDRVMVVEQFRFGALVRGDRRPWSLEPIAGRIDPGETPEQAVMREAAEETGLAIGALHHVGSYYPSPGAVSEYLFSYVGLADLADDADRIGGVEGEAEDIRAIVLSFDGLMRLLQTGEAQNGPLILTALWLARERERLRAG